MGEMHLILTDDHMPEDTADLVDYLRTMSCVDPDRGTRRMPTATDDAAFDMAADRIELAQRAFVEIERLRLATADGTLAKRSDRMWEIACEMLGRPIPGAAPFIATDASGGDHNA